MDSHLLDKIKVEENMVIKSAVEPDISRAESPKFFPLFFPLQSSKRWKNTEKMTIIQYTKKDDEAF